MASPRLLTKILADFLSSIYLLNWVLKHATNLIQPRCVSFEKNMEDLNEIEKKLNLTFPMDYKKFYLECQKSIPKGMVGTDLFNNKDKLKEWALDLLKEDNTENFLTDNDFVFMMHQGYMFWYFKIDGTENPSVCFL